MAAPRKPTLVATRAAASHGRSRRARRASLWYGLALLIVLGLVQMYYMAPVGRQIAYSEFKTIVQNGQVAEVTIGDQVVRGTLKQARGSDDKSSKQFTTTRVDDPKLAEELEAKGVKFSGEVVNRWLPDVLGWVLPLIFIVVLLGILLPSDGRSRKAA